MTDTPNNHHQYMVKNERQVKKIICVVEHPRPETLVILK